jgi:hypothetical protein
MNLDLGTLSGVLGVVLTVIFFLIGYRQTLGAKKERIRAANEIIIDTLLRRLILEPNFSIPAKEVEKFISGKALDARLTYSDVISGRELEAIIYSRIVDNDYVAADARKTILARVNECFRISEPLIESRVAQPRQADGQTWSEISLGVVAAFMSLVGGLVSYYFFRRSELLPSEPLIIR